MRREGTIRAFGAGCGTAKLIQRDISARRVLLDRDVSEVKWDTEGVH